MRCNSSAGLTEFSETVSAAISTPTEATCNGFFECNPELGLAVVVPIVVVVTALLVLLLFGLFWKVCKSSPEKSVHKYLYLYQILCLHNRLQCLLESLCFKHSVCSFSPRAVPVLKPISTT